MGNTLKKSDEPTLNINNKVKRRLRKRVKTEGIVASSALSPLEKICHEEMAYPPSITNSHNMMYMVSESSNSFHCDFPFEKYDHVTHSWSKNVELDIHLSIFGDVHY